MTTTTSTLPPAMEVRSACSCCGQSQPNNMLSSQLACGHMQAIVEEVQLKNTNFLTFNSKRGSRQRVCCSDAASESPACSTLQCMHPPTTCRALLYHRHQWRARGGAGRRSFWGV